MKRLMLLLLGGMTLANGVLTAQERVAVGRGAARDGTIKITAVAGVIRVAGWMRDSIAVTGTIGTGVERIEVFADDRTARVQAHTPRSVVDVDSTLEVNLEIRVPRGSYVGVRTVTASVEAEGVEGGIDVESETGDIRVLRGGVRNIYAETAGGNVDIAARSKLIRAKTVDGNIGVRNALGFVELATVSGRIDLQGEALSQAELSSVSGDILFDGSFERGAFAFSVQTHGGTIELRLPATLVADFDVRVLKGRLENEFGPATGGLFSTGRGGPRLDVTSFKGRVRLLKRQ